jgi:ABC-type polysaccharide transport system permease subunit
VQFNEDNAFAYRNLDSIEVERGQEIDTDWLIGRCAKYAHVEYLKTSPENLFRVLLVNQMFYKQDPMDILINGYESMIYYATQVAVSQAFLRNVHIDGDE